MSHLSVSRLSVSRSSGHGRHNHHDTGGNDDDADDRDDEYCEGVEHGRNDNEDDVPAAAKDDHHSNVHSRIKQNRWKIGSKTNQVGTNPSKKQPKWKEKSFKIAPKRLLGQAWEGPGAILAPR